MEFKHNVNARMSITWSNTHQRFLNQLLATAVDDGMLIVLNSDDFVVSENFFLQPESRGFLAGIPREMLDQMIAVWIKKYWEAGQ